MLTLSIGILTVVSNSAIWMHPASDWTGFGAMLILCPLLIGFGAILIWNSLALRIRFQEGQMRFDNAFFSAVTDWKKVVYIGRAPGMQQSMEIIRLLSPALQYKWPFRFLPWNTWKPKQYVDVPITLFHGWRLHPEFLKELGARLPRLINEDLIPLTEEQKSMVISECDRAIENVNRTGDVRAYMIRYVGDSKREKTYLSETPESQLKLLIARDTDFYLIVSFGEATTSGLRYLSIFIEAEACEGEASLTFLQRVIRGKNGSIERFGSIFFGGMTEVKRIKSRDVEE